MHLLAARPGAIADGTEAIDLAQSPGDIVVLSAADTELACLAHARARVDDLGFPSLRLASLLHLGHNMSVDLYVDSTIAGARLVVARLLGGAAYWPYGIEQVAAACRERGVPVAFLPGDDQPDPDLAARSTVSADAWHRLWQYCVHSGIDNAAEFLRFAASLIGDGGDWREPRPLLRAGLYWPKIGDPDLAAVQATWVPGRSVAAVVFYRALVQAGNLAAVDALIDDLQEQGINPLPIHVASLKDPVAAATVEALMAEARPDVILNATGFAVSPPGKDRTASPFDAADAPVLQVVFAGSDAAGWRDGTRGLAARDIAMNVALPEVDGRVLARAVSFKGLTRRDELTETDVVGYEPQPDRIHFVAALTAAWAQLRKTPASDRRVAVVLANYPNRDGRLANGVGLDTPAGTVAVLRALADAGYRVDDVPADSNALVARLTAGPTNDLEALAGREIREVLPRVVYETFLASLAPAAQAAIEDRWGRPEDDPLFLADRDGFAVAAFRCGNVALGLQPARGYHIDPQSSYHDPGLVPPHGYLAFYAWMREAFGAHAVVHMGKHGNLEWLPGKALALSAECFPEVALGPLPHLYPFIVNDPGEGTQAKRRAQAVIIDHLTPPLTRAESYGPLKDLELLVDEYYEAAGVDPRRLRVLAEEILTLSRATGIDADCGMAADEDTDDALTKLDA